MLNSELWVRENKTSYHLQPILWLIFFCPKLTDSSQPRVSKETKWREEHPRKENIRTATSGRDGRQSRGRKTGVTCLQSDPGINDTHFHEALWGPWFISSQLVSVFMLPQSPNQSPHSGTSRDLMAVPCCGQSRGGSHTATGSPPHLFWVALSFCVIATLITLQLCPAEIEHFIFLTCNVKWVKSKC